MSLTDITSRELRHPLSVDFVGVQNFVAVLSDPTFQQALLTTGMFVVLCVPICIGMGLLLAIVLNQGVRRLRAFFRAVIYVPVIANIVAASVIWKYAFSPTGPVNAALAQVGVDGPSWLGQPPTAIALVVALSAWRNIGTCMVLFLAGLQTIPEEIYEAAAIDGAGTWQKFRSITVPMLRPTVLLVTVLMTVAFLNIFEEPYLLTAGGPVSTTRSVALWTYQKFGFGVTHIAMAGSFILLIAIAVVSFVQFRVIGREK
ncbi:MAG: sugar ABC transporter permease [Propionicimonas sp.]|uniref:carbohydrate ABC transporter permease n=1 Tax=Propionicimonas sp. TaxID=1955623 RepID=UPI002B20EB96|nr:sugar ABC transporter permease [Propionicimonas sp.]MEA4945452.1 sugar ABC transporter permease [Propionicimonas sp.]MEA5055625.1 sugar ABC transporter permease [Propionicimonas sp.]MEA5117075.1 sugar ABC transporter permease [Propionicimonas sp.]